MTELQKPSIGRIVHFGAKDTATDVPYAEAELLALAAIVTRVHSNGTVSLQIFGLWTVSTRSMVPFASTLQENHWTWPPRV